MLVFIVVVLLVACRLNAVELQKRRVTVPMAHNSAFIGETAGNKYNRDTPLLAGETSGRNVT